MVLPKTFSYAARPLYTKYITIKNNNHKNGDNSWFREARQVSLWGSISQTVPWFKEQSCLKRYWGRQVIFISHSVSNMGQLLFQLLFSYPVQQLWSEVSISKAGLVNEVLFPSLLSSSYNGLIAQLVQQDKTFCKDQIRRRLGLWVFKSFMQVISGDFEYFPQKYLLNYL